MGKDLKDEKMLEFVRRAAASAKFVTSHCDGSFVLAKAGLLGDVESTTFPGDIGAYRKMFPDLKVHEDVVLVHDGRFITSVGGARSFEAALYLADVLYGTEVAKLLARGMAMDWDPTEVRKVVVKR